MIFDAHSDILYDIVASRHSVDDYLNQYSKFNGAIINYYFRGGESPDDFRSTLFFIKKIRKQIPEKFILSIEGLGPLRKISDFELLVEAGIRCFSLTWNDANYLGCGTYQGNKYGLTALGIEILNLAAKNDLVLDLSHASEKLFFQALKYYKGKVFVSHADARAVHDDERNLTDEMAMAIKDRNGLIGLNVYGRFVGQNHDLASFIRHVDHMVGLIGIDHVCLGFDIDPSEEGRNMIEEIKCLADTPKVLSELARIGYNKNDIEKIAYRNIRGFLGI